jgi:hypothetical protein
MTADGFAEYLKSVFDDRVAPGPFGGAVRADTEAAA